MRISKDIQLPELSEIKDLDSTMKALKALIETMGNGNRTMYGDLKTLDEKQGGLWETDGTETQLITADEIDMQTKKIINVVDPAANQDAATKKYVDDTAGVTSTSCSIYLSSQFTVNVNTATAIDWNAESFDAQNMHDNSTNPSRITVPTSGIYMAISRIQLVDSGSPTENRIWIAIDGVNWCYGHYVPDQSTWKGGFFLSTLMDLTANNYLEIKVYQDGISPATVVGEAIKSFFSVMKIY